MPPTTSPGLKVSTNSVFSVVEDPVLVLLGGGLVHPGGAGLVLVDVVGVAAARLRVALPTPVRILRRVLGVVDVLVVDLAHGAGADALPVPHVEGLARVVRELAARGLVLDARDLAAARLVAGDVAPLLVEVLRVDVPEDGELVLVVGVLVPRAVGRLELLPLAVGLLDPGLPLEAPGRVLPLQQDVDVVLVVHRLHGDVGLGDPLEALRLVGGLVEGDLVRGGLLPRGLDRPVDRRGLIGLDAHQPLLGQGRHRRQGESQDHRGTPPGCNHHRASHSLPPFAPLPGCLNQELRLFGLALCNPCSPASSRGHRGHSR